MTVQENTNRIVEHLQTALSKALSSMTGQRFQISADGGADHAELSEPIVWQQELSAFGEPALWIIADKDLWKTAGEMTLAAVGIDSVTDDDCRSTWQEIVSQTVGSFCTALSADLQQEITAVTGDVVHAVPPGLRWNVFNAASEAGPAWHLRMAWADSLPALYRPAEPEPKTLAVRDSGLSKTFDLLLDVALPVSVSFGKTSLQIREVLKLNTGSIVELNRFVAEPVDVVVNDCVIARGEVVVVDGNYGVRITQLSSREDRIRFGMAESSARSGAPLR